MAESTLSVDFTVLRREVGKYLGYGRTIANHTANQVNDVDDVIQSGYRQFLTPPPLQGQPPHQWSFLKPTELTIVTVADDFDYDLPDNYGGIIGNLTFSPDEAFWPVQIIGEQRIRELRIPGESKGRPTFGAVRPKKNFAGDTTGQRFEIIFYPTPNAVFNLSAKMKILLNKLTATNPFPPGGENHGETILTSCLEIAESRKNDEQGVQRQKFMERLTASIHLDRVANNPELFPYNRDNSDVRALTINRNNNVTVGGVLYDGS